MPSLELKLLNIETKSVSYRSFHKIHNFIYLHESQLKFHTVSETHFVYNIGKEYFFPVASFLSNSAGMSLIFRSELFNIYIRKN